MAETKTKTEEKPASEAREDLAAPLMKSFVAMQRTAFGPAYWFGTAWLEALGDLNAEFAQFLAARIQEDVKTQHEILHCRDATRLRDIQVGFIERAIEQYTAETGKLVEMSQAHFQRLAKARDA